MQFTDPAPRHGNLTLLPMINVVFLLLVFFLLAGEMRPAEPFAVQPPEAAKGAPSSGGLVLAISAEGRLGFAAVTGADDSPAADAPVLAALEAALAQWCAGADCAANPPALVLRADRGLEAGRVARLLPVLAGRGFGRVELAAVTLDGAP